MKNLLKKLLGINDGITGVGVITIRSYKEGTKELLQTLVQRNLIMQSTGRGKNIFIERLGGSTTYTAIINYGAIGTGSTAPAVSDTQLGTETARTTVALSTVTDNSIAIQFYFPSANLANGTYNEFGTFVDGTASANTGRLFNRALFTTPYIKATGTDTTVEVDITFT